MLNHTLDHKNTRLGSLVPHTVVPYVYLIVKLEGPEVIPFHFQIQGTTCEFLSSQLAAENSPQHIIVSKRLVQSENTNSLHKD